METTGGVGEYFKFHKRSLFHLLYQPSALGDVVPLLAPFQKRSFFPFQFGQEENISENSTERRVY